MTSPTEIEYLKKLRAGDAVSFRWVYDRYHKKVYGYCFKLLNERQVAEEITEDVFVKIWQKRASLNPDLGISPFLFKLTRDFAWNHLKKASRVAQQREAYDTGRSSERSPAIESRLVLQDYLQIAEVAIQQLPQKRQTVFNLRYKNGLESREIAQQLNISETTVRVHLSKATRFLKSYLKAHPEMPFLFFVLMEQPF